MTIKIMGMAVDGQAFLYDEENGKSYYMHEAGNPIEELKDNHLHPMNLQGNISAPPKVYEGKNFNSLDDARRFICKSTLEWIIDKIEKSNLLPEKKEQYLSLYKEELKQYD